MPIHESQLPAAVRNRARQIDPKPPRAARNRTVAKGEAPEYVCMVCGWRFRWTTAEGNPAHLSDHMATTGHVRYQQTLASKS